MSPHPSEPEPVAPTAALAVALALWLATASPGHGLSLDSPGRATDGPGASPEGPGPASEPPAASVRPSGSGPQARSDPGRLSIRLLTFGPGERVWEKFGHNALWIHDPGSGRDAVYNWGIFDFEQEDFFVRLVGGAMRYRVARTSLEASLRHYRAAGRTVRVQDLRFTPAQAREVARLARIHHLPENRRYDYDPFRDNCSTRIRDLLDRALDGRIRRQTADVATGTTYRSHTRRLLQRVEWAYLGIMVFLGAPTDQRLSVWDEMFLPVRMDDHLREVEVEPDGEGGVPLASEARTLHRADRPPVPDRSPGFRLRYLAGGLAGGGILAVLGLLAGRGRRPAARGFQALAAAWSVGAGAAGLVALGGWIFTGHWYVHLNANVLQVQPLSLFLAGLLPLASRKTRARSLARTLAWLTAGLAVLGLLLDPLAGLDQVNGEVVALTLPLHAGLALGLEAAWRRHG